MNEVQMRVVLQQARTTSKRIRFTFYATATGGATRLLGLELLGYVRLSPADKATLETARDSGSWGPAGTRTFDIEIADALNTQSFVSNLLAACEDMSVIP